MKKYLLPILTAVLSMNCALQGIEFVSEHDQDSSIVIATKEIHLKEYPGAWNPSIVKFQEGYLMTFRWSPKRLREHWISYIGVVFLNESFEPISKPKLLDTRLYNNATPSQSEDARIICIDDRYYIIYNDNMEVEYPSYWERRDMYIAEVIVDEGNLSLSEPLCLRHKTKSRDRPWQKNWSPFEWKGQLLLSYAINPHEMIVPNLSTGECIAFEGTNSNIPKESWLFKAWEHDSLRGGTPAQLVDGEYLAFFHSGVYINTLCSEYEDIWHYFVGAYTFSANPPFAITKASPEPIDAPGFYTYSNYIKRVIYPGGFVVDDQNIYLAYGKDDCELWIATIDRNELKKSLKPIKAPASDK